VIEKKREERSHVTRKRILKRKGHIEKRGRLALTLSRGLWERRGKKRRRSPNYTAAQCWRGNKKKETGEAASAKKRLHFYRESYRQNGRGEKTETRNRYRKSHFRRKERKGRHLSNKSARDKKAVAQREGNFDRGRKQKEWRR